MARFRAAIAVLIPSLLVACAGAERPDGGVSDDWGRTVRTDAPARRIVSLAPAFTELVYALGLGGRLVGRTQWCNYPAEATEVADVGNGLDPNVEAIAERRPDLVLLYASEANRSAAADLEALGIPVAVLALDRSDQLTRAARLVAALAGTASTGDSLAGAFDSALAASRTGPAGRRMRVYVDVAANPPVTVGRGSYISEILELAGAENVFADLAAASGPVSLEAIVARDPDAVLVLASDTTRPHRLASRPGWSAISAVRSGRVLVVDGTLYGRPSPRMPYAVRDLGIRLSALGHRR